MEKSKFKKDLLITGAVVGVSYAVLGYIAKKKKPESVFDDQPDQKNPLEGKKVKFVSDSSDPENADGEKGHLEAVGESTCKGSFYDKYGKRALDVILSGAGLILLSPVFAGITLAIKIDDPGPVLFTQKRVGENKQYFKLHKFRSMKMSTPHDVPTHMLENPDQYITRVGKFIRSHSLDELPQIWDIFVGNMSVIGPRPALWNQDVLTAERDKYGANDIKPGLTGWAQINGRDELELSDKAKLDGEYVKKESLEFDLKCFLGSVGVFKGDKTIVEGGTGEMKKGNQKYSGSSLRPGVPADDPVEDFAFKKKFIINTTRPVKVLVVGAGSYIGESFKAYAEQHYPNITVDTVGTMNGEWKDVDFSSYDSIYDVAGIAHADVGNVSDEVKEKYYKINTDLTLEIARKAKEESVKPTQFIFMSSAIIYGDSAPYGTQKMIDENTVPSPANFYGDSKWQADKGVRALASEDFNVAVLRPPMIYGKGSKGNYPTLSKLAKKLPVFPDVDNERSMLYIGNLCEFLCKLVLCGEGGIYFPQNAEYTKTSRMVKEISKVSGKKEINMKLLNPAVKIAQKMPGKVGQLVDKAFGNLTYDRKLSRYEGLEYQNVSLKESIKSTEGTAEGPSKKKVLFLVNHEVVIYNFRLEIVERLLHDGYEVHISSPYGERIKELQSLGAIWHDIKIDRHGMNPKDELGILENYRKLYKEVKPDIILGFTIKPNIYGAIAAKEAHIPFVANITGLGTAVENGGWKQKLTIAMYKYAFTNVQRVFVQNEENKKFFIDHEIAADRLILLPGSGVNLERFPVQPYSEDGIIRFAFISRIMKEKGIDQYLETAKVIKKEYPNTEFHICGFCEKEYADQLEALKNSGTVIYHGMINDVSSFLKDIHCVIHPSYYPEGLSNVLLEASASGRPIITTDRPGCREVIDDGVNGYMIPEKDEQALIRAVQKFIGLSWEDKKAMGLAGRAKVEEEFDRQIVVDKYLDEVRTVRRISY